MLNIEDIRNKHQYSQEKMANIIWITRQTYVSRAKKSDFSIDDIKKVEKHFYNRWEYLDYEPIMIECMRRNNTSSLQEIEEFLEFLQDMKMLNRTWDEFKHYIRKMLYKKI